MFRAAANEANLQMLARYDYHNAATLEQLVAKGITLVPFDQEILSTAEQASFEIYEDYAMKNQHFRRIYEPWSHFRETILRWNRIHQPNQALSVKDID